MSSAICLNLDPSKILSSGNGLNLLERGTKSEPTIIYLSLETAFIFHFRNTHSVEHI